ncbi:MAG: hypothetical protein ACE5IR_13540 [bacterium]
MKFIDVYKPIRRNSYSLTSAMILAVLGYYFVIRSFSLTGIFIVGGTALLLLVIWLRLRPGKSEVASVGEVTQAVGNGRPTFLNVYSNY